MRIGISEHEGVATFTVGVDQHVAVQCSVIGGRYFPVFHDPSMVPNWNTAVGWYPHEAAVASAITKGLP